MPARIVQLSDLHLTAQVGARQGGADVWGNLDAALRWLRGQSVDLLVLTGDLAGQRRLPVYQQLRERLQPWLDRLCVLPGNHDSRRLLRQVFADLLLPELRTANFRCDLCGWRLLGLDSVRQPFVHACFGRPQLRWLDAELLATTQPVLLFAHHPPIRVGCWWLDKDLPRDLAAFAEVIRGSIVQAIACGHVHQPTEGCFAGARVWTAPAVAYQFAPHARWPAAVASRRPGCRVIDLAEDAATSSVLQVPV